MKSLTCICVTLLISAFTSTAVAAPPTFPSLNQQQAEDVIRELSANGNWASVTPPSSMGTIFGFELGLVGGLTETPSIRGLVEQTAPGSNVKYFPHAGLLGVLSTPIPLTAEVIYFPRNSVSGVEYEQMGAAVKWNLSDNVLSLLPVNLTVRGFYIKSEAAFTQNSTDPFTGNPLSGTVNFNGNVKGLQVMVSPKLIPILEPYAGVGYLMANGSLGFSGTGQLFGSNPSNSTESSPTSTQIFAGLDVRLLLIGFGVEYSRAFGTDSYTGKLSFKF